MPVCKIEVISEAGFTDTVVAAADRKEVLNHWVMPIEDGRAAVSLVVAPGERQELIDQLRKAVGGAERWQILVEPVEAAIPAPEEGEARQVGESRAREELFNEVAGGAQLGSNYFLLVALSTVVAAIGLVEDNVAVVIGAMVIAPLLGPNLALTLGAALGDRRLIGQALASLAAGVSLTIVLSVGLGTVLGAAPQSHELITRTAVGLDSVALALASGAAAVLSLTTGISTALVGVMVAVALLPPATALGLFLGAGQSQAAVSAALLLAVNIASVNLAGQLVFLLRGVRPRTWLEQASARQSTAVSVALWVALLALLTAAIVLHGAGGIAL